MRISAACIQCMVDKQSENIKDFEDEQIKSAYLKEVLRIIGNSREEDTTPVLSACVQKAYEKYFGESMDTAQLSIPLTRKCSWRRRGSGKKSKPPRIRFPVPFHLQEQEIT